MKKVSISISSVLWTMLAFLLLIPGIDGQKASAKVEEQETNAQPETLIVLHVTGPNGEEARATVFDGGFFSIEDQQTGERTVFLPNLSATNRHNVILKVFRGTGLKNSQFYSSGAAMRIGRSEEVEISLSSPKHSLSDSSYNVEIEAIIKRFTKRPVKSPEVITDQRQGGFILMMPASDCCISCNGRLYCSNCSVETPCGCCHSDVCAC